jgi:hypothetical protein
MTAYKLPECIHSYSIWLCGGYCPCPVVFAPLFLVMLESCICPTGQYVPWLEMTLSGGTPVGLRQTPKHVLYAGRSTSQARMGRDNRQLQYRRCPNQMVTKGLEGNELRQEATCLGVCLNLFVCNMKVSISCPFTHVESM